MKLREALELIQQPRPARAERECYLLACSSTPIHLQTFLHAFLLKQRPHVEVQVESSLYGDLLGALERLQPEAYHGVAVVCEWYDLDPRLGFRRLGGWVPSGFDDIVTNVRTAFTRVERAVERIAGSTPVAITLPTLPWPPLEISAPAQALSLETRLGAAAWTFAEKCASRRGVRLVSPAELDRQSPLPDRFDLRAEISHGFPYRLAHASALANLMSSLLVPATPLKGLITDLDDTLWDGILGEAGVFGVSFTLDAGAQIHGLYQQVLQSLAERGVLLGIASKNDPRLAEQALARADLLVRRDSFFPVEANWGRKSESIGRILKAWNIGPEAVAFVDDSPLESAEVRMCFPQIRCLPFPKNDPGRLLDFFHTLREWFGRATIRGEDRIRARSLERAALADVVPAETASHETFLAGLQACLSFKLSQDATDERAFELINKTNQFNLNGRRLTEAGWREILGRPGSFLVTVGYADRFGPLGKIAAMVGARHNDGAVVSWWCMSCRAFSRRIEYAALQYLFEGLDVRRISLEFEATERNGPLREFLASLGISESEPEISRADFHARCPLLPHTFEELTAHV
ncbi:MAG TPA: HAD-IIIC family phosphatase [Bryobacteraceae bacterium]|nr:HAD-IIIC family phosphatase [Bryobacteraceae bacterium]